MDCTNNVDGKSFFSLTYQVNDFEEAKAHFRVVAVGLGSAQEEILRSNGFPEKQIYALKIGENPAQLLLKGRVDAWFNGVPESLYIWSKISNLKLLVSPPLAKQDIYLACSKICDPEIVLGLKRAVEKLRGNGFVEAVKKAIWVTKLMAVVGVRCAYLYIGSWFLYPK